MADFTEAEKEDDAEIQENPISQLPNNHLHHENEDDMFKKLKDEHSLNLIQNPAPHTNSNLHTKSKKSSNYDQFKASIKDLISKNPKEPELKKPFINVLIFGMTFFFLRSTFLTPSNMTPQIYDLMGYTYLGEIEIMMIYGFYGISSLFHTTILQRVPLKICLMIGGFTFPVFNIGGYYAMMCVNDDRTVCNIYLVYTINIVCAIVCGSLMGLLWTVQSEYVSTTAPPGKIGMFMGVFYAFAQAAQALSTILSLVLLLYCTKDRYYLYLFVIGIFFAGGLNLVPAKKQENKGHSSMNSHLIDKDISIKAKPSLWFNIKAIFLLLKRPRVRVVSVFWMSTGLCVAFYSSFLYKIINISVAEEGATDEEKNQNLEKKAAYVFILLGVSEFIGGFSVSYFADKVPVYLCALLGQLLIEVSLICTMLAYNEKNYSWTFIAAFFWGIDDCFIRSLSNVLCKNECKKEDGLAGFSLYRFFFGMGSIVIVVLSLLLNDYKNIFMLIVFVLQIIGVMSVGYLLWDEKKAVSLPPKL